MKRLLLVQAVAAAGPGPGPLLFGGGCLIENENLVVTGAFSYPGPLLATNSFKLELNDLQVSPLGHAEWLPVYPRANMPNDLVLRNDGDDEIYYMLGLSPGADREKISRRSLDNDNPLSKTSLAKRKSNDDPIRALSLISGTGIQKLPSSMEPYTREYLDAVLEDLRIAVYYKDKEYYLIPSKDDKVTIIKPNGLTVNPKGSIPSYSKGFSATLRESTLFLASNQTIHRLDLDTFTWASYTIPGLRSSKSGCLSYNEGHLIHAFGILDSWATNTVQIVSIQDWEIKTSLKIEKYNPTSHREVLDLLAYFAIGALTTISIIFLTLSLSLHIAFKIKSRLLPPEILTAEIWAEPSVELANLDLDCTLANDPFSFYDTTLDKPALSNLTHSKSLR